MNRKHFLVAGMAAVLMSMPSQSQALSCIDPASMIENYATEDKLRIFTGTAVETVEYVNRSSAAGDPNRQFDSGYTAQLVKVTESHSGYVQDEVWVYHQKDGTWGYLCASGPVKEGEAAVFIVNNEHGLFAVPSVVNSFAVDSELATQLLEEMAERTGTLVETEAQTQRANLGRELKEMIFIIRMKLAEWRWWGTQ